MRLWIGKRDRYDYILAQTKKGVLFELGISEQMTGRWQDAGMALTEGIVEKHFDIKLAPGEVREIESITIKLKEV